MGAALRSKVTNLRARAHSLTLFCMRMRKMVLTLCTREHVDPLPCSYDWNVRTGYWNENLAWNDLTGTSSLERGVTSWATVVSDAYAAEEAHVGRDMAINVYQWLREVCTTKLLSTPIQIGGPGKVVQIDESLFRQKKNKSTRKMDAHHRFCQNLVSTYFTLSDELVRTFSP